MAGCGRHGLFNIALTTSSVPCGAWEIAFLMFWMDHYTAAGNRHGRVVQLYAGFPRNRHITESPEPGGSGLSACRSKKRYLTVAGRRMLLRTMETIQ